MFYQECELGYKLTDIPVINYKELTTKTQLKNEPTTRMTGHVTQ